MTEAISIEAIRAAGGVASVTAADLHPSNLQPSASAVARFEAAMGVNDPAAAASVPFISEATAAWRSAQVNNQGILHRIRALSDLRETHAPSMGNLVELQYEVMNLAFQQEVVTKVADKASTAIQTLIKNQ